MLPSGGMEYFCIAVLVVNSIGFPASVLLGCSRTGFQGSFPSVEKLARTSCIGQQMKHGARLLWSLEGNVPFSTFIVFIRNWCIPRLSIEVCSMIIFVLVWLRCSPWILPEAFFATKVKSVCLELLASRRWDGSPPECSHSEGVLQKYIL